jgi:hypothetical protein
MPPTLVAGFLSREECRELIGCAEGRGFRSPAPEYPPSYRNNDRQVLDDPALAARLLERLRPHLPERIHEDGHGVHFREDGRQSRLTFVVYLNDAAEFAGGSTRFFPARGAPPSASVPPAAGTLILFMHDLWHDGEEVSAGIKYVLRSDVLYQSDGLEPAAPAPRGYLWNVVEAGAGRWATGSRDPGSVAPDVLWSGSRDRTVRVWHLEGERIAPGPVLRGHEGAVLHVARLCTGAIASASADGTIRWWTRKGEPLGTLDAEGGWVWALAALDGTQVACGTEDGALRVWDLAGHEADVRAVVPLPGGAIAGGSEDGTVRVWDGPHPDGVVVGRHADFVTGLCLLEDGTLASASYDGTVGLWELPR